MLLKVGSQGEDVKKLQTKLGLGADGIFGAGTEKAVKDWQAKNGLTADGIVGDGTWNKMFEASKEGFKFRGRGYIQLTGKSNYTNFAKFIGEDTIANPDLVANKYPLASAAFFFDSNKLWAICDKGATDAVVTEVTKRVNGGTIGLPDRIKHFKEYYSLLA